MRSFHNTTREPIQTAIQFDQAAKKQEQAILDFFRNYPGMWTPSDVFLALPELQAPITSIRRAISNLTDAKLLKRSEAKKQGMYGRPEHYWTLDARYHLLCNSAPCKCSLTTTRPKPVDYSESMGEQVRQDAARMSQRSIFSPDGLD